MLRLFAGQRSDFGDAYQTLATSPIHRCGIKVEEKFSQFFKLAEEICQFTDGKLKDFAVLQVIKLEI